MTIYLTHIFIVISYARSQEKVTLILAITAAFIMLTEAWHFIIFYLIYELAIFLLLPLFSLASRSFRRSYALLALYVVIVLGSFCFLTLLALDLLHSSSHSSVDWSSHTYVHLILAIIVLVKVPSYPLYFWLPEAHVESTWIGSVILACILLKFSLYCCLLFTTWSSLFTLTINAFLLAGLSLITVLFSLSATSDLKRTGAFLSIIHMNLGLYLVISSGQLQVIAIDTLWSAHSTLALLYFYWVGQLYSVSGSRLLASCQSHGSPVLWLASIFILVLNLALPVSPLFLSELALLSQITTFSSLIHLVFFWFVFVFYALLITSSLIRASTISDIRRSHFDLTVLSNLAFLVTLVWYLLLWPD